MIFTSHSHHCVISLANSVDLDITFTSLWEPGKPKNECHIQRCFVATASRMIVGLLQWPLYSPFPHCRTVLPGPVHTLKWSKHPSPSSCFTLCHQALGVFLVGCPQVLWSKNIYHCFGEPSNGLQDCVFTNADVVVNCIGPTPICQDLNNRNTLHQRAWTYLSTCTFLQSLN